jgi:hypothetical protein
LQFEVYLTRALEATRFFVISRIAIYGGDRYKSAAA